MKLLLNSCMADEIERARDWAILSGVTMNPSMVSELEDDYVGKLREICEIVDVPVFAQVVSTGPSSILEEGKALAEIAPQIVVKVHTSYDGIKGMALLKKAGVPVCATAIHSTIEALVAAQIGADHAAVFIGLLAEIDEISVDDLLTGIRTMYDRIGASTQLLVAARSIGQVVNAAILGVDEVTCSFRTWSEFLNNAHTKQRWERFSSDWRAAYGDRNWITG